MTAPHEAGFRFERDRTQWADYGVNVGNDLNGFICIHPPAPVADPFWFRPETARPVPIESLVALRSALSALASACGLAAEALSYVGPMGQESRSDEKD